MALPPLGTSYGSMALASNNRQLPSRSPVNAGMSPSPLAMQKSHKRKSPRPQPLLAPLPLPQEPPMGLGRWSSSKNKNSQSSSSKHGSNQTGDGREDEPPPAVNIQAMTEIWQAAAQGIAQSKTEKPPRASHAAIAQRYSNNYNNSSDFVFRSSGGSAEASTPVGSAPTLARYRRVVGMAARRVLAGMLRDAACRVARSRLEACSARRLQRVTRKFLMRRRVRRRRKRREKETQATRCLQSWWRLCVAHEQERRREQELRRQREEQERCHPVMMFIRMRAAQRVQRQYQRHRREQRRKWEEMRQHVGSYLSTALASRWRRWQRHCLWLQQEHEGEQAEERPIAQQELVVQAQPESHAEAKTQAKAEPTVDEPTLRPRIPDQTPIVIRDGHPTCKASILVGQYDRSGFHQTLKKQDVQDTHWDDDSPCPEVAAAQTSATLLRSTALSLPPRAYTHISSLSSPHNSSFVGRPMQSSTNATVMLMCSSPQSKETSPCIKPAVVPQQPVPIDFSCVKYDAFDNKVPQERSALDRIVGFLVNHALPQLHRRRVRCLVAAVRIQCLVRQRQAIRETTLLRRQRVLVLHIELEQWWSTSDELMLNDLLAIGRSASHEDKKKETEEEEEEEEEEEKAEKEEESGAETLELHDAEADRMIQGGPQWADVLPAHRGEIPPGLRFDWRSLLSSFSSPPSVGLWKWNWSSEKWELAVSLRSNKLSQH